jgi:hypothetical protein
MSKINGWNTEDPEIRQMVEAVKWELASEMGLEIPRDGYWGNASSKDLGKIGSQLRKRVASLLAWQEKKGGKVPKTEGKAVRKPRSQKRKKK